MSGMSVDILKPDRHGHTPTGVSVSVRVGSKFIFCSFQIDQIFQVLNNTVKI